MRNISKPVLIGGGALGVAIIAFLAFGVFGVHLLFIDEEVNEANPFEIAATADAEPATDTTADDESIVDETMADDTMVDDTVGDGTIVDDTATETTAAPAPPEIVTVTSGTFVDGDHPTSGSALTITDGSQTFLRFESFETDNGPDLNVYLRSSADPDDYLDLGDLSGNIGDQNYELPAGIDLDRYDFVDIWCVRFGVSFGSATLAA